MRAEELRVGSYISTIYPKFKYEKVKEIKGNVIYTDNIKGISYISIKPIPLTEEILLKCGLNRNFSKIKECSNSILEFEFIENRIDLWLTYKKDEDVTIYSQLPHIKHLHQLQNLYYCLTGEELEITL